MRIAVFVDFLEIFGGGERVAMTLAKGLDADLVTTSYDPGLPARAGFEGIRVVSLGDVARRPPLKQIHATWKFRRARLRGYDFHILLGSWALYASRAHRPNLYYCLTPTRAFFDHRETILRRLPARSRWLARAWTAAHGGLERRTVSHCDRIIALSENVRLRVRRAYGRDAGVIYPPVSTSKMHFADLGDFWLSVTRWYPEKRLELQIETFRRLPDERLVIVGGHAEGDLAVRYTASLNPPPNVTFLRDVSQDELVDLYARCRGLITTAVDEDFGITPVEAMAAGKCVLATDEGGYRETIVDGETGFLLRPDPDAFVTKIRALSDASLRGMRSACEARAREFDEAIFLEKVRDAIPGLG